MSYPFHKKAGGSAARNVRIEKGFWGLDLGKDLADRPFSLATDTENMMWEGDALRIRHGYRELYRFSQPINGIFHYGDQVVIHSGTSLYATDEEFTKEPTLLFDEMADRFSFGVIRRQKVSHNWLEGHLLCHWRSEELSGEFLFIQDGKNYLFYDGAEVHSVIDPYWGEDLITKILEEELVPHFYATIPFTTVAKLPLNNSGDTDPRGDNYITQFRCESFYVGTEPTTIFYLQCPYEAYHQRIPERIQIRDRKGVWRDWHDYGYSVILQNEAGFTKLELPQVHAGIGFMIDKWGGAYNIGLGEFNFMADDGMDNYRIIYAVHKDPPKEISGATAMGLYGVDGKDNVLFFGGSADAPGTDRFSDPDDFFSFRETSYEVLGDPKTPITGYCRLKDGRLAVLKNDERQAAIHFRSHKVVELGATQSGEPYMADAYPSVTGAGVAGCINPRSVGVAGNEPCYLTHEGIFSVRSVSDELINLNEALHRSRAIDLFLQKQDGKNAAGICWRGKYLLSFGSFAILTDGRYDSAGSYRFLKWRFAHPISALSCKEGELWLGGADGGVYRMEDGLSTDAGEEISAFWQTPVIEDSAGKRILLRKAFASCSPRVDGAMKMILYRDQCPEPAREFSLQVPDFGRWDFSRISFSGRQEAEWIALLSRSVSAENLYLKLMLQGSGDSPQFWGIRLVYEKGGWV